MGMDIIMNISSNGKYIAEDIFNGRNAIWFDNLQGKGHQMEYEHLPAKPGIASSIPNYSEEIEKNLKEKSHFGFFNIKVGDYKDWFEKYRPDTDAGWVTTYDRWRIEHKGYIPDEIQTRLSPDDVISDMHFMTFVNRYDCSAWLYAFLVDNNIKNEADITYYFNN